MKTWVSQRGVTLLEALIALGLTSTLFVGVAALIDRYTLDTAATITAQHIRKVGDAGKAYIKDNWAAVAANATSTTPALITVSALNSSNYLSGVQSTNGYGQTVCILVLKPTATTLNAIVVAEGGTAFDDITLASIAGYMGASGGGVYSTDTATLRGTMGGWSTAIGAFANANQAGKKCDGTSSGAVSITAGHPVYALWFENGDSTSGFLYRNAVSGRPELNQMQTTLDLGNNRISGVMTAIAGTTACTTKGDWAQDATTGAPIYCDGAKFQAVGASANWVATFANLPSCNASSKGVVYTVITPTVGTGARGYACNGLGSWDPLGVNDSGNLVIAGTMTAVTASISGNATVGGTATVTGNLSGNTVTPTLIAVEGSSCAGYPQGAQAQTSTGLTLACQFSGGSWRWAKPGSSAGWTLTEGAGCSGPNASSGDSYSYSWYVPWGGGMCTATYRCIGGTWLPMNTVC